MKRRPIFDRLVEKIDRRGPDECWPWMGARQERGYGLLQVEGSPMKAHRLVYEFWTLQKAGEVVMHACDNPCCCNPRHLSSGTVADNNRDKSLKGRARGLRGEMNPNARLTAAKVLGIYHEPGTRTAIAKKYGLGLSTVSGIKLGRQWAHVTNHRK